MKKAAIIFLSIFLFLSCDKYENTCECENPLEDLVWLRELKDSFTNCNCRISIFQANYHGQTVFYSRENDPLCDGIISIVLKDCSGNSIKTYQFPNDETFFSEVKDQKVIYTCKTGE